MSNVTFHNFSSIPLYASTSQVQSKLEINTPGDAFEKEADQMAEQVMKMPHNASLLTPPIHGHLPSTVQRKCANCEEDEQAEGMVMRQEQSGSLGFTQTPPTQSRGVPQQSGGSSLYLPRRVQTIQRDFHDPNFCYQPGAHRDATHPDRSKVVAVMQAEIETPQNCDGIVILRTSILRSGWGAASGNFEAHGGGTNQGILVRINRNLGDERVDYEEHFSLDTCHAIFSRCHYITYMESGTRYTFAEAGYQPAISAVSGRGGTIYRDQTPPPILRVEPCNHITPTLC